MNWRTIVRLLGTLVMIYSLSYIPSIGVSLFYGDGQSGFFITSFFITAIAGALIWLFNYHEQAALKVRDGFLIVVLFWTVLGGIGALPFIVGLHLNATDAIFESVSGFTTTGATVIAGLDLLPPSILYHRQQINWLGGMGFVVLAVAILPQLGVGGMQLYRAEMSGVAKEEKITPRIAETARSLWLIYVVLTLACAFSFWAAGMSPFDAIGHAYATLATGGFSTHDANIGYFNSPLIEVIAIFFMLAGGTNFAVHFFAWKRQGQHAYVQDAEVRMYFLIFIYSALFVALSLYLTGTYENGWQSLRYASFQTASILTNTGFGTATFAAWPLHIPLFLVALSYIGGCVGSTAGGMKVFRIILLAKLALQQLFLLAHPRAVSVVKHGGKRVPENVIYSVWGFYVLYIVTAVLITGGMMATGLNLETAFGAVTATINTLGPGLGDVAATFTTLTPVAKWLGIFAMLIGRLEVFTVLILFLPAFWRR